MCRWYNGTVKKLNWLIFEKRLQVFIASTKRGAPLKKSGSPVYTNLMVCSEIDLDWNPETLGYKKGWIFTAFKHNLNTQQGGTHFDITVQFQFFYPYLFIDGSLFYF